MAAILSRPQCVKDELMYTAVTLHDVLNRVNSLASRTFVKEIIMAKINQIAKALQNRPFVSIEMYGLRYSIRC